MNDENESVKGEIERAINNATKLDPNNVYLIVLDEYFTPKHLEDKLAEKLGELGAKCVVLVIPNPQQSVVVHELHKCRCEEVLNEVQQLRAELNHDPDKFHVAFPGCCK